MAAPVLALERQFLPARPQPQPEYPRRFRPLRRPKRAPRRAPVYRRAFMPLRMGGSVPVIAASTGLESTLGSFTNIFTKPSGLTVGDLMTMEGAFASDAAVTPTLPSGWLIPIGATNTWSAVTGTQTYFAWKVADAADVAATDFTFDGTVAGGLTKYVQFSVFRHITGAHSTAPICGSVANQAIYSTGFVGTFPSVTTTCVNNLVLLSGYLASALPNGSQFPNVVPSGTTASTNIQDNANFANFGTAYFTQSSAGATGSKTVATDDMSDGGFQAITVAIAPSSVFGDILDVTSNASSTSDATTFVVGLPFATAGLDVQRAGLSLLAVVSADGNGTLGISAGTGWTLESQTAEGTGQVKSAIYSKAVAAGTSADNLTVSSSNTQQYSAVVYCVDAGASPTFAEAGASGSSTNSDPPNLSFGGTFDALIIATRSGDGTTVATAAPSGYGGFISRAASGANGASTNTATKLVSAGTSENPGAFTSVTEQWVAYTVAILKGSLTASSAESGSAASIQTAVLSVDSSRTEAGSAAESASALLAVLASVVEAGSAADVPSAGVNVSAGTSEAGSAADAPSATLAALATISEAGAALDALAAVLASASSRAEAGSAADALSAAAQLLAAISESGSATDAPAATGAFVTSQADNGSAADQSSTGAQISAVVTEAGSTADASSAAAALVAARIEAGTLAEAAPALLSAIAVRSDVLTAQEASAAYGAFLANLSEALVAAEVSTSAANLLAAVEEAVASSDASTASAALSALVTESGSLADLIIAVLGSSAGAALRRILLAGAVSDRVSLEGRIISTLAGDGLLIRKAP